MTRRTRARLERLALGGLIVLTATALSLVVPALIENVTADWGGATTLGGGLALLVAWAFGTLATTPKRSTR